MRVTAFLEPNEDRSPFCKAADSLDAKLTMFFKTPISTNGTTLSSITFPIFTY
jgi:hypothetical protein